MMESSRLSSLAVTKVLDGGCKSLPWHASQSAGFLTGIDFDRILAEVNAKEIIQSLPPQPLLAEIKRRGIHECLAVLAFVSDDQFTRFLDYDAWQHDQLAPGKFLAWIMAFLAISPEEGANRFVNLEEEYQLSLLVGKIQVILSEEFEKLDDEVQDEYFAMPCNLVFYRIRSFHEAEIQAIANLIEALKEVNLSYAYTLLSHAAYMPPQESEFEMLRFRNARLEEDGFVSYEESLQIFIPLSTKESESLQGHYWKGSVLPKGVITPHEAPFADVVMDFVKDQGWSIDDQFSLHQGLLFVANSLCTASSIDAADYEGQQLVLEQLKAIWGFGLEYLAQGSLPLALDILQNEHPKTLFRFGLTLVDHSKKALLDKLSQMSLPKFDKFERYVRQGQAGAALLHIDKEYTPLLGLESAEILKGIFNRYPMYPESKSEHGVKRLTFQPLASLYGFHQLMAYTEGFLALCALVDFKVHQLDQTMGRIFLAGLLQRPLDPQSVKRDDIALLMSLSQQELTERVAQLSDDLARQLQHLSGSWQLPTFCYNPESAPAINVAMHLLSDQMLNLLIACKNSEPAVATMLGWAQFSKH